MALPQSGFSFQDSELPCPLKVGMLKTLICLLGLVLALFQIALQKILAGTVKPGLRVPAATAREHASQSQEKENEFYGLVWPLAAAVATCVVPSPRHPSFMLMPVSSK